MKPKILPITALFTALLVTPVGAENLSHLNQLLSTKKCDLCDLTGSGLVMADLANASLKGADLRQANLSQANLQGADLSGANLTGASLHGANLTGANLAGANLTGTDLRNSYLSNATLINTNIQQAFIRGAYGIPNDAGSPETFQSWGQQEALRGNYTAAVNLYTQAITIDPKFAPAYLSRSFAQYRLGNEPLADQDAKIAVELFKEQQNESGEKISQNFLDSMVKAREARNNQNDGGDFGNLIRGIAGLAMQYFLGGGL